MIVYFASGDSLVSEAIKMATFSQFSHCAIAIGRSVYEATMDNGVTKCSYADFIERYSNPESIQLKNGNDDIAETWLLKQVGKQYDYTALAGFVLRRDWQEEHKWFCSELVAMALIKANLLNYEIKTHRVTPRDLWYACKAGMRL